MTTAEKTPEYIVAASDVAQQGVARYGMALDDRMPAKVGEVLDEVSVDLRAGVAHNKAPVASRARSLRTVAKADRSPAAQRRHARSTNRRSHIPGCPDRLSGTRRRGDREDRCNVLGMRPLDEFWADKRVTLDEL